MGLGEIKIYARLAGRRNAKIALVAFTQQRLDSVWRTSETGAMNSSAEKDALCLDIPASVRQRQYEKVRPDGTCHRWLGTQSGAVGKGYGRFKHGGKSFQVHRAFLLWQTGAIRPNHIALHTCGNQWCVNAKHLRWGTPKENGEDASRHRKHGPGMPRVVDRVRNRLARAWQALRAS